MPWHKTKTLLSKPFRSWMLWAPSSHQQSLMAIWRIFWYYPCTKTLICLFLADSNPIIYHLALSKSLIHLHGLPPPITASSIDSMIAIYLMSRRHYIGCRQIRLLLVRTWKNGLSIRMDCWITPFIQTFSILSWWVPPMTRQISTTLLLAL